MIFKYNRRRVLLPARPYKACLYLGRSQDSASRTRMRQRYLRWRTRTCSRPGLLDIIAWSALRDLVEAEDQRFLVFVESVG